ncbi:hypothetical protein Q4R45_07470 [Morganella morganii subsp. sibonii]
MDISEFTMASGNKFNLGKLGEDTFSLWCTEAELVSNRSHDEDVTGWDHLVEFPYIETKRPKDSWNAPVECKVQVKSTQRKDRSLSIKSSVLKRLIDYSYPAFILFLEFDKNKKLENSYLVHIDEIIINKVLKEIRRNHISQNKKELHKLKISINYSDKNKLSENTGACFKKAIYGLIPNSDINKYQESKKNIVKYSGYNEFNFQVKFSTTPNNLNKLIFQNIFRGNEKLEVTDLILSENRFNLPNGEHILHNIRSGSLVIKPSTIEKCNLYIKSSEYSPAIVFNADVFPLPNITTQGSNLLIFRSCAFSLIVGQSDKSIGKSTIKLIQDKFVSILELIKTLKSIQLIKNNNGGILGVDFKEYRQLTIDFVKSNINDKIFDIINPLDILIKEFNLDSRYETTLNYLASNYGSINAISKIITNDISNMIF